MNLTVVFQSLHVCDLNSAVRVALNSSLITVNCYVMKHMLINPPKQLLYELLNIQCGGKMDSHDLL